MCQNCQYRCAEHGFCSVVPGVALYISTPYCDINELEGHSQTVDLHQGHQSTLFNLKAQILRSILQLALVKRKVQTFFSQQLWWSSLQPIHIWMCVFTFQWPCFTLNHRLVQLFLFPDLECSITTAFCVKFEQLRVLAVLCLNVYIKQKFMDLFICWCRTATCLIKTKSSM